MNTDAYHAFMLDHASGALDRELTLAAELHLLLSEDGRDVSETWDIVRDHFLPGSHRRGEQQIPEALELARADFATVPWRRGLSGVHYAKRGPGRGQLMRLDPGQTAPEHGHSAREATLVLKGEFSDGAGHYKRGDLVVADKGSRHRPAAYGQEMCICYVARAPRPFWRLS